MHNRSLVSVIIPVHNGAKYIKQCLDALMASYCPAFEILVVDDCSTDQTVKIAEQKKARILQLRVPSGPAGARNFGAQHAEGDILLFIDSDIVVRRETIGLVVDTFCNHPDIVAVFGSYDDDPAEENFISQYKNLFHHFHHQHSNTEAYTFWAGCGAVRKEIFEDIGGFNHIRYKRPSIEDIELGYRIRNKGHRIFINKNIQVKHLKHWKFLSMIRTDIFQRAIPWTRLILETKFMPNDLNLKMSQKISSLSLALIALMFPMLLIVNMKFYEIAVAPLAGLFSMICFINILILNRKLYVFYARKRGLRFMIMVIPFHILYYLYSGLSFVFCWVAYKISAITPIYHSLRN